jgi:hypothetical protein
MKTRIARLRQLRMAEVAADQNSCSCSCVKQRSSASCTRRFRVPHPSGALSHDQSRGQKVRPDSSLEATSAGPSAHTSGIADASVVLLHCKER